MESDAGGGGGRRRGRGQGSGAGKGNGKGLVVGIAAVVLVGVGGRFLAGLGKLKGRSARKDVVGEAIVSGDAAVKLGRSSEDLAEAALGSALHRMNGEGKGLGLAREELGCRESDGGVVGEGQVKGFVVNGTFREKDGVPSLCAEVKVLGVKRGVDGEEGGNGHVEGVENGALRVVGGGEEEEVVAQVEDELVLPEAAVKDGLADLKIVTSVSYPDSLVEVTCTAVGRDGGSAYESSSSGSEEDEEDEEEESTSVILPQEEEREQEEDASSSVSPEEDDEGSSTPIEPALLESVDKREVFVGDGSPSISSAETVKDSTSVQTSHPLLLSPRKPPRSPSPTPSRLQSERSADRSSKDPDLISSHLLHSRAPHPAATTHFLDLLQLPETAVAQPTTPARESEKVFSVKPASPLSDGESAFEKDARPEKDAESDGESAIEKDALPEKEAEAEKLVMPADAFKEALKAVTEARDVVAQLLVDDAKEREPLERVALKESSNIGEEVRPGVVVSASKVLLDTHNSSVQAVKATIVAAPAFDLDKQQSGEFWAYVGRGVPSVMLLGFFFLVFSFFYQVFQA